MKILLTNLRSEEQKGLLEGKRRVNGSTKDKNEQTKRNIVKKKAIMIIIMGLFGNYDCCWRVIVKRITTECERMITTDSRYLARKVDKKR